MATIVATAHWSSAESGPTQSLHLGEGDVAGGCWALDGKIAYLHYGGSPSVAMARELGVVDLYPPALLLAWDLASNAIVDMATVGQLREGDGILAIDEQGKHLLLRRHRSALIANVDGLSIQEELTGHEGPWAGCFAGNLPVWLDGSELVTGRGDQQRVSSSVGMWAMDVDAKGKRAFVAGSDAAAGAAIHSLPDGALTRFLAPPPTNRGMPVFSAIKFLSERDELVLGGWDGGVWRWPLADARPRRLGNHGLTPCHVNALVFDGQRVASLGTDGCIAIWDLASEERVARISAHSSWIQFAALRPTSGELLTGGNDGAVRLWPTLEALATSGDALAPHSDTDFHHGRPGVGIGRAGSLLVTKFSETMRAFAPGGEPIPCPTEIDWLHTPNRLENGVLIVGDKEELRLSTSDASIGPVALHPSGVIVAIGMERRIDLKTIDGVTSTTLALEHPAAALEFLDSTLVAMDEAGHVHTWGVTVDPVSKRSR